MDARSPNRLTSRSQRESGFVQRVRASLNRDATGRNIPRVLIACSGGQDSVALASVLATLAKTGALRAEIVHVDHHVRDDSGEAAEGVRHIGEELGLPVYIETLDNGSVRAHKGVGAEEALRRERYLAFGRVAQRRHANVIALAHHQRDQAETVLLHLIRGTGLHGATGIREWTTMDVPWWNRSTSAHALTLWRPFLGETWDTIAGVARGSGLPVFEDSTNLDRRFRRNAIRQDVLPLLESLSAGSTANIARFAELAGEDDDELERMAEALLQTGEGGDLDCRSLLNVSRSLQRRVVRRWIFSGPYDGELTLNRIDAICDIAMRNRSGSAVDIGAGWQVHLSRRLLRLRRANGATIVEGDGIAFHRTVQRGNRMNEDGP